MRDLLESTAFHVALLTLVSAAFGFAGVADVPLDGDPAMYGTIARTILHTGEWLHLTFNGDPYLNKPPMHFWLNAGVFSVLHPTALTASLVPGLFGIVDTLLVYALCRATLGGWREGLAAALVYATTPEVAHWGRGVHLETLVTFWILVGIAAADWSVADGRAVLLLGVAAAGGFLAKGPQGMFPLAVAVVLWWYDGVLRARLLSIWSAAAVFVIVAGVGPWLWVRLTEGTGFADVYFGEQIGAVLFGEVNVGRGPLWYLEKLFRTYWPWLPVALAGIVLLAKRFRASRGARLWLVYGGVVLFVITAASVKKSRYLFQLYPALAAAAGVVIATATVRRPWVLRGTVAAAVVAALVVLAIGGERVSDQQAAHTRDALDIAGRLVGPDPVRMTRALQNGTPQLGKIVGFYAAPLLRACRDRCEGQVEAGAPIVTRADEAEEVATVVGGAVAHRNASLAIVVRRDDRR